MVWYVVLGLVPAQTNQADSSSRAGAARSREERKIRITRSGSTRPSKGPAGNFTGSVRIDTSFQARGPGRAYGSRITFDPGARTAWHSHPLGQTLIVTAGSGRVQQWGSPIAEIQEGDVIWIPPNQKHWHGADPNTAMTHLAISEQLAGRPTIWMEKVSDAQYNTVATKP
jgi:quercetin dioxygenase-like cupin family protein